MNPFRFAALLGLIALAACQGPELSGQARADEQTRAACQRRAEEADKETHRAEIYAPSPSVNTPYSADYVPGDTGRGLSDMFAQDRMVNDCIRNTGTQTDRAAPATPAPAQ